jgi:selenocysteine lyase/cysteine desulfurase
MVAVAEATQAFLPWYASSHEGSGTLAAISTSRFEEARRVVRAFVGCRDDDYLVFTRNTTDAVKLLAMAVPEGTTVVVFDSEHHALLLPWRDVRRLPIPASVEEMLATLDEELRTLGGDVLVAVSAVLNVTGELMPLEDVVALCRRHGARVAVDAAQLAAHQPIDIAGLDVDYVAFSGHKMYAPFGIGVLAGRPDWLGAARPHLAGCGATVDVGDGAVTWASGAARHEAGGANVLGGVPDVEHGVELGDAVRVGAAQPVALGVGRGARGGRGVVVRPDQRAGRDGGVHRGRSRLGVAGDRVVGGVRHRRAPRRLLRPAAGAAPVR